MSAATPNPRPTVTLAVIARDHADFVERAVASAFAQTRPPHELLLVDDGSTDGTRELLAARAEHARFLPLERGGPAAAYNAATAAATGEWIAFLEGDDWLEPDFLESVFAFVADHPDAAWVGVGRRAVDEDDRPRRASLDKRTRGELFTTRGFLKRDMGRCGAPVARRAELLAVGPWSAPSFDVETDMALRFSLRFPMYFLDRPLYVERRPRNGERSRLANALETVRHLENLADLSPEWVAANRRTYQWALAKSCGRVGVALRAAGAPWRESGAWLLRARRAAPWTPKHWRRWLLNRFRSSSPKP